jgi:hypothetical protein
LLLWLVLIITALNVVRLITAIAWRGPLASYMPVPGPVYVAVTGAIWALTGLFVLWSFWRGRYRTRWVLLIAAGSYAAWVWVDRLFVQAEPRADWLFTLLATILLLGYMAAVVLDPRNESYFRKETYERKPEEPSSP